MSRLYRGPALLAALAALSKALADVRTADAAARKLHPPKKPKKGQKPPKKPKPTPAQVAARQGEAAARKNLAALGSFGGTKTTAARYYAIYKATSTAMRKAYPDAKLLYGELATAQTVAFLHAATKKGKPLIADGLVDLHGRGIGLAWVRAHDLHRSSPGAWRTVVRCLPDGPVVRSVDRSRARRGRQGRCFVAA